MGFLLCRNRKIRIEVTSACEQRRQHDPNLFDAMSSEDTDTQMSVQEALGLMAPAFRQIEQANRKFIEAIVQLMSKRMKKQVRLVAVQSAGDVVSS